MITTRKPAVRVIDEELSQLIARHMVAHHVMAEKRHYAETGSTGPIDEDLEAARELVMLLRMAEPNVDGDEQATIARLKTALLEREAHLSG